MTVITRCEIAPVAVLWGCMLLPAAAGCNHPSVAGHVPSSESAVGSGDDSTAPIDSSSGTVGSPDPSPPADGTQVARPGEASQASAAESPAPPSRVSQPPRADRTPRRPGEAEKVTFDDLNLGMQADVVFRPFMLTDRVKEFEGQRVVIAGYMHGGQASQRGIKDFILLKNTQCKFGPGGQADHLANVILRDGTSTRFTPSDIRVEGTLKVEPFQGPDGNTWSIYRLEDAQIR
jgi:hypothetical protein